MIKPGGGFFQKGARTRPDKMATRCFYGRNSSIIKLMPSFFPARTFLLEPKEEGLFRASQPTRSELDS